MDSNTKQLMAVFSLMLGISWGIPYMVSDADERNAGWLMLAVVFLLIALGFYMWIMREQQTAEEAASDALDAAEENLKKLEAQAADAVEDIEEAVEEVEEDIFEVEGDPQPPAEPAQVEVAVEDEPQAVAIEVEEVAEEEPVVEAEETPVATASGEPDDLERIEGIGPKYAEILTGAGITTFGQIATMSEDEIIAVIKANGGRKSASMGTWADQAKLAAAGDWDGLAKLQDELNGGRR